MHALDFWPALIRVSFALMTPQRKLMSSLLWTLLRRSYDNSSWRLELEKLAVVSSLQPLYQPLECRWSVRNEESTAQFYGQCFLSFFISHVIVGDWSFASFSDVLLSTWTWSQQSPFLLSYALKSIDLLCEPRLPGLLADSDTKEKKSIKRKSILKQACSIQICIFSYHFFQIVWQKSTTRMLRSCSRCIFYIRRLCQSQKIMYEKDKAKDCSIWGDRSVRVRTLPRASKVWSLLNC